MQPVKTPVVADSRHDATQQELRVTLENDLGELGRVNDLATDLLERHGFDDELIYAAQLALEECLSNVIRHGFEDRRRHEISLVLRVGDGVEIQIEDDGREFDPLKAARPALDRPLAERRVGGLGIHLLRKYTREIRYARSEDRNRLWVRI
jgi:anti-sigma regulatory factor (Ser/Thr protein kinase)